MFNLSLREEWANNKTFCHRLTDCDDDESEDKGAGGGAAAAEDSKAKVIDDNPSVHSSSRKQCTFIIVQLKALNFQISDQMTPNKCHLFLGGRGEAGGQHFEKIKPQ